LLEQRFLKATKKTARPDKTFIAILHFNIPSLPRNSPSDSLSTLQRGREDNNKSFPNNLWHQIHHHEKLFHFPETHRLTVSLFRKEKVKIIVSTVDHDLNFDYVLIYIDLFIIILLIIETL